MCSKMPSPDHLARWFLRTRARRASCCNSNKCFDAGACVVAEFGTHLGCLVRTERSTKCKYLKEDNSTSFRLAPPTTMFPRRVPLLRPSSSILLPARAFSAPKPTQPSSTTKAAPSTPSPSQPTSSSGKKQTIAERDAELKQKMLDRDGGQSTLSTEDGAWTGLKSHVKNNMVS